ncbi:hypothetical protein FBUS_04034 [Fasciolopsis buskii]|uniref:HMG box domain-containing protein n=1 Tax=Fasciolopsis buskii TaxID=27845 RepID=A0A8E0VNR3_9TREM|nr:hypothetical protein FBUS_04034 [Fasciolopsis buski]
MSRFLNSLIKLSARVASSIPCSQFSTSANIWNRATPYQNFVRVKFAEIKQQNPTLKNTELFKKLGESYRQLSATEKLEFQVPDTSTIEGTDSGAWSEKRKSLMYAHRHGMPRKPPASGLNVYIQEKLSDLKGMPLEKVALRLREAVKDWNALSEEERKVYSTKATELKAEYEKELHSWATEHKLRFTKNLTVLTHRFYERERKSRSHRQSIAHVAPVVTSAPVKSKSAASPDSHPS